MSIEENEYFYNAQIRSYILQFMAIFSGLQVKIGKSQDQEEKLISTPITYGHKDRVVAAIIAGNTQNKMLRLPTMSAYVKGLNIGLTRLHGTGQERRNAYTPIGGLIPDDMRTIYQRMPLQYDLEMELGIYVSNTDQHFQILEQILPLFDPQLNIQTSDSIFDWTRLTSVELKSIIIDSNYPIATDRRIIQSTLNFSMNIYLDIPANVRANIIHKVYVRIGAISASDVTNFDIIADLDQQGIPYEIVQDAADLDLNTPS